MILVTGATGTVGRQVVAQLRELDLPVRAVARGPGSAGLPSGTDVVRADLADPVSLEPHLAGVDAVFLVWPFTSPEEAAGAGARLVELLARHVNRLVYLSAQAAGEQPDSFWAAMERMIENSGAAWTFLRPTGFAANTLGWAEQIRNDGVVRWPYGAAARSLIHEHDLAAVAVRALAEDGHAGQRYVLTGPEAVTQAEQVTKTVEEVTGRPARPFWQWAADHASDFGAPCTASVAASYVSAFRVGDLDGVLRLLSADLVRAAPMEDVGGPGELRGAQQVMDHGAQLNADYEIHSIEVADPLIRGDQFAVRFAFDRTHRPSGRRETTVKVSLYTVAGTAIVREEVYYHTPPRHG